MPNEKCQICTRGIQELVDFNDGTKVRKLCPFCFGEQVKKEMINDLKSKGDN